MATPKGKSRKEKKKKTETAQTRRLRSNKLVFIVQLRKVASDAELRVYLHTCTVIKLILDQLGHKPVLLTETTSSGREESNYTEKKLYKL